MNGAEKRKILYIITKSNFGGAQRYVYDCATSFRETYDVSVALGGFGPLAHELVKKDVEVVSLEHLGSDVNIFNEFKSFFSLLALYKKVEPDIIHLNSSKAGGIGAFAARVYNIGRKEKKAKIIFTAHGWAFTDPRFAIVRKILLFLQWLTIRTADVTIAVSRETKQEIASFYPRLSEKIATIHNGIGRVETLYPRDARKALVEHTPFSGVIDLWSNQTLWIGTIAELNKNKGIDIALAAIHELKDYFYEHNVSLVYFVLGEGEDRKELEEMVRKYKLSSLVFMPGFVENASLYLRAFDIFLLPSRKEGFPYVVLEAGAAGVPVISTEVGGVPEVIHDETSGLLVLPDNKEKLKEAILEYARDPRERHEHGMHLQETVTHNFTLEKMLRKTYELYESLYS